MNEIKVFENSEFGKMRTIVQNGKVYFCASDAAAALGYRDTKKAIKQHCREDGWVFYPLIDSLGRKQNTRFITEGNLYRLIVRSKLESAQRFEVWIFDEIIPAIRKYGFYVTDDVLEQFLNDPDMAIGVFSKLKEEREKVRRLECENKELSEKCSYLDLITRSPDAVPITVIAKDYDMSACEMNQTLHHLGVQYRMKCGTWVLYQEHVGNGYTRSKTFVCDEKSFSSSVHTYWTQKGRKFIYEILRKNGILPLCERRCKV